MLPIYSIVDCYTLLISTLFPVLAARLSDMSANRAEFNDWSTITSASGAEGKHEGRWRLVLVASHAILVHGEGEANDLVPG